MADFGHLTVREIVNALRKIRLFGMEDSPSFQYLIHEVFSTRGEIRWELMIAKDGERLYVCFSKRRTKMFLSLT